MRFPFGIRTRPKSSSNLERETNSEEIYLTQRITYRHIALNGRLDQNADLLSIVLQT
ncbi:hypothetical protein Csa_020616 [Cucumis sativus]|uniref:Uncharacterized protein n=1 Tax=Cucumis sativus TaxID=3659 RepID=A0A0A0KCZ0_CUCSA|nr:hypothetical protein Csa_020616 [Cucumis sativus]